MIGKAVGKFLGGLGGLFVKKPQYEAPDQPGAMTEALEAYRQRAERDPSEFESELLADVGSTGGSFLPNTQELSRHESALGSVSPEVMTDAFARRASRSYGDDLNRIMQQARLASKFKKDDAKAQLGKFQKAKQGIEDSIANRKAQYDLDWKAAKNDILRSVLSEGGRQIGTGLAHIGKKPPMDAEV